MLFALTLSENSYIIGGGYVNHPHVKLFICILVFSVINNFTLGNKSDMTCPTPLEFFFQEQSYSSLHSGLSLAWDHIRGDIDDPCGAIADFCGVIAGADRCATC